MSERADQALASHALTTALARHKPAAGAIHHSDQGVQYTSKAYQQQLRQAGLVASMSRPSMPYDNAVAESFFATLKLELMEGARYATREDAKQAVFEYLEIFYNRTRMHSSLDYRSPAQAARDYLTTKSVS